MPFFQKKCVTKEWEGEAFRRQGLWLSAGVCWVRHTLCLTNLGCGKLHSRFWRSCELLMWFFGHKNNDRSSSFSPCCEYLMPSVSHLLREFCGFSQVLSFSFFFCKQETNYYNTLYFCDTILLLELPGGSTDRNKNINKSISYTS